MNLCLVLSAHAGELWKHMYSMGSGAQVRPQGKWDGYLMWELHFSGGVFVNRGDVLLSCSRIHFPVE